MASSLTASGLLAPVIALNGWTLTMEIWMYATRLPVFTSLNITGDNTLTRAQIDEKVPAPVRWIADNYNHLMEQPTNFYAVTLALAILKAGKEEAADVKLAWAYVALRVLHSFIQATTNNIPRRFVVFLTSSGVLGTLTFRAAKALWEQAQ